MAYGLVVPNEAEIRLLEYMLNITAPDDPVLWLYSNNITPDENSVIGTFTPIAGTNITLDPTKWVITTVEGAAAGEYPTQVYTLTNEIIYGYYVANSANDKLLWAQRCFFAPVTISGTGDFSVTPRISTKSLV